VGEGRAPSALQAPPPNTTTEIWVADSSIRSSDLGEKFPHPDCDDESAGGIPLCPKGHTSRWEMAGAALSFSK